MKYIIVKSMHDHISDIVGRVEHDLSLVIDSHDVVAWHDRVHLLDNDECMLVLAGQWQWAKKYDVAVLQRFLMRPQVIHVYYESLRSARIAFAGPGSAGKTTTAMLLSDILMQPFQPSLVRHLYAEKQLTEQCLASANIDTIRALQDVIIQNKKDQDKETLGIYDRTMVDHLAYMMVHCHPLVQAHCLAYIQETQQHYQNMYDYVAHFTLSDGYFPEKDEHFRSLPYSDKIMIDALISYFLYQFRVAPERAPHVLSHFTGMSPHDRAKKIIADIVYEHVSRG